jgi:cell division protein FtsL
MARLDDRRDNVFLVVWTLSVVVTTVVFLFYLAVRVRTIELGYELGRSQAELARLREVERVLELELSARENPERVELIAKTLLGMDPPEVTRIMGAGSDPSVMTDREGESKKVAEGRP